MKFKKNDLRKLIEKHLRDSLQEAVLKEEEAEDVDFSAGMTMVVDGLKSLVDAYSKYSSIDPDEPMLEDISKELEELELVVDRINRILRL